MIEHMTDIMDHKGYCWKLVDEEGHTALRNEEVNDFRGDPWQLTGGRPPVHEGSTGRVYARKGETSGEFFPNVFNLKWVRQ
jgi:hypothetical protein